jgi:hypothetical protein
VFRVHRLLSSLRKQAEFARTLADKLDGIKLEPPKKKALKTGNEARHNGDGKHIQAC